MELWHVGLCYLCAVIGALIGAIMDMDQHDEIRDSAYARGYRDGRSDEIDERLRRSER